MNHMTDHLTLCFSWEGLPAYPFSYVSALSIMADFLSTLCSCPPLPFAEIFLAWPTSYPFPMAVTLFLSRCINYQTNNKDRNNIFTSECVEYQIQLVLKQLNTEVHLYWLFLQTFLAVFGRTTSFMSLWTLVSGMLCI